VIWIGTRPLGPAHLTVDRKSTADILRGFAGHQKSGKDHQWLAQHLDNPHNRKEVYYSYRGYNEVTYVDHAGGHWPVLVEIFDREWWQRV
jgi:hypothetical protein